MVNAITSGDILSAEQLKKHSKVYAGPGAGKTYFLVENVKNIITTNEIVAKSKARKVLCIHILMRQWTRYEEDLKSM